MTHNPTVLTREALAEIRARAEQKQRNVDDGLQTGLFVAERDRATLLAYIESLLEPTDAMVEALKPFAELATKFDDHKPNTLLQVSAKRGYSAPVNGCTVADLRRARAALKAALALAKPQEHNGSEGNG